MLAARVISVAIGYIFGLFVTGYFIGKTHQVDLRTMGSGNVGATNTMRNLGAKAGAITLLGDCGKTILAMLLIWAIFHGRYPDGIRLLELYAGAGAILGHNFPITLKFKGGKGVACTAGLILFFSPIEAPVCILVFVGVVVLSKYVSLASILVMVAFVIQTFCFSKAGWLNIGAVQYQKELYILVLALAGLCIIQHRANIGRLLHGTENKVTLGKHA